MFNPLTIILLEIPTGLIGDRISRKLTFMISSIFCIISFLMYYVSSNLVHCIVAEIVYSIGFAFYTGSLDAIIISEIKKSKQHDLIGQTISSSLSLRVIGTMIGGAMGIVIYRYGGNHQWLVGAIGLLAITIFVSLFLEESYYSNEDILKNRKIDKDKILEPSTIKKVGEKPFYTLIFDNINKNIVILIFLSGIVSFINAPFFNYWALLIKKLGVATESNLYIIIYSLYMLFMAIGSKLSFEFNRYIGKKRNLSLSTYLVLITSGLMAIAGTLHMAILFFFISEFARGVRDSVFYDAYNEEVENSKRSLMLSLLSLTQKLAAILSLIITKTLKSNGVSVEFWIAIIGFSSILPIYLSIKKLDVKN